MSQADIELMFLSENSPLVSTKHISLKAFHPHTHSLTNSLSTLMMQRSEAKVFSRDPFFFICVGWGAPETTGTLHLRETNYQMANVAGKASFIGLNR